MPSLWLTKTWWQKLLLQYYRQLVYYYNLKKKREKIKIKNFIKTFVGFVFFWVALYFPSQHFVLQ